MKIGVISDTHMREMDPELENALAGVFADVDMIIHAGDLTNIQVLDGLDSPNVVAVAGNMDDHITSSHLPVKRVLRLEGHRIGVIHGYGAPNGLEDRIRDEFEEVEAIIYGHSHQPANHVRAGVLFFNPGSVSRGYRGSGTVGILEVGQNIKGEIISL
jgi:putative phosphoesterase